MKSSWRSLSLIATLFLLAAEPSLARNVVHLESPELRQSLISRTVHDDGVLAKRQNTPAVAAPNPPADGKDGKPHNGPWVETAADRERKVTGEKEEIKFSGKLPYTNDGVMDDKSHKGPEAGKSGTEGGVTAKTTEQQGTGANIASESMKKPSEPKEAPPLPHSEQERLEKAAREGWGLPADAKVPAIPGSAPETTAVASTPARTKKVDSEVAPGGMKIPVGLPDTPHDIPHPVPDGATRPDNNALASSMTSDGSSGSTLTDPNEPHIIQPFHSFVLSFTMILFSEIGDKTFLVAALMAMKHSGMIVFSAAFAALAIMTVLSAVLGQIVPTLLTTKLTSFAAAILFLVFGAKMLREGLAMSSDEGIGSEMREVELELEEAEAHARKHGHRKSSAHAMNMDSMDLSLLEAGRQFRPGATQSRVTPPESPPSPDSRDMSPSRGGSSFKEQALTGVRNLFGLLFTEAWVQTFIMTFLGEWGDRSQIATIAMAAGDDYTWVTLGAFTGHSLCTAAAVVGGRALAGRVSLRIVTLGGAIAFLVFGVIYAVQGVYGGK